MKGFHGLRISDLFTLHGCDDHFVTGGEFFEIVFLVGLGFGHLESLSEEVIGDGFLDSLCMGFLVIYPADDLVGVCSSGFRSGGEFCDLLGGLIDGLKVGVHFAKHIVIGVYAAGDLAVCRNGGGEKEAEGGEGKKYVFHTLLE